MPAASSCRSYANPGVLTDELIRQYLQPLLSSPERIDAFQRYWLGFDNAQTVAIHDALRALEVPTLIVFAAHHPERLRSRSGDPPPDATSRGSSMDIATFHARRRFAETASGRIAYIEDGEGPVALFVHGVPLNGYHWRHVIDRVRHRRRCIAVDLMALGYTEIAPTQDVSFTSQARMLAEVLDVLGMDGIDLVGNDSGGAIAQIYVWGLQDFFFDKKWAYWLRDTIPGAQPVVEVDDARLFFPEDRPDSLTQPMLRFWSNLSEA